MAKDGTNRGGRRVRAGDKPAPAAEKKQKGLPVKIISNDIPALDTAELEAVDLPEGAVLNGTATSAKRLSLGSAEERSSARR